jgi:hypothetical protein
MPSTTPGEEDKKGHAGSRPDTPTPYGTTAGAGEEEEAATSFVIGTTREKGKAKDAPRRASGIFAPTPIRFDDARRGGTGEMSSSSEDDEATEWGNLESQFSILWKRKDIYKVRRQEWIREKARSVVDHHGKNLKLRFSEQEYNDLLITAAESIADQYITASRNKISSRTSTPLTDSYADPARITMAEKISVEYATPEASRTDAKGVHFKGTPDRDNTVTPRGTAVTQPLPNVTDADWDKRYDLTLRREGELKLFGNTSIPEQGILFDKTTPVDEWRYPEDGKRVRGGLAGERTDPQASNRSPSPPPVPSKDSDRREDIHASGMTRSTFIPPTNTAFVNHRRRPSEQQVPLLMRNPETRGGSRTPYTDRTHDRVETLPRQGSRASSHPGYGMPTMTTTHDTVMGISGIREATENHRSNMKDRLSRIIDDALGVELPLPEGYKPSYKTDKNDPKKYDGSPKLTDLEDWLSALVNRYALQRLGGHKPEIDRVRVMLLLDNLDGAAYKWMLRHVTHVNREVEHWTFRSVVHGLYARFVHPSSMQDARENLNNVKYSQRDGIQLLHDNMMEYAGGMAVFPDDYTLLSIFLDRIPEYIMTELLNTRGLSPEVNNLSEFVAHALDIEQRKKNETYYKERRSTRGTTTRTTRGSRPYTTPRRQTESETKTPERIPERNPRYEGTRGYGQNNRGLGRPKPWAKAKIQDKKQDHTSHQHGKERQKWNGGPSKPRDGQKNNNCYNCGKAGHFSNDCLLPKRERTFVRAARSVKTNGSDGEADDESRDAEGYDSDKLSTISENNEDRNGSR